MTYRIRFAVPHTYQSPATVQEAEHSNKKSRHGCRECKKRHVKCDETFPVCLKCQKRGILCSSAQRRTQWQTEMPWLKNVFDDPLFALPNANRRLIQYWLEKCSPIMVLNPTEDNPWSWPILQDLPASPSLLHAVQSWSAGHENFFAPDRLETCLEERGRALSLVKEEIQNGESALSSFLTVYLLGQTAAWLDGYPQTIGEEHLIGARGLLDVIIANPQRYSEPATLLILGYYLFWDMANSFIAGFDVLPPLNTVPINRAIQASRGSYHPVTGVWGDLFYLIGSLGRYCRQALDGGQIDPVLEASFEEQLLNWQPNTNEHHMLTLCEAYRSHGLIMLYRICGRSSSALDDLSIDDANWVSELDSELFTTFANETAVNNWDDSVTSLDVEQRIRAQTMRTIASLLETPVESCYFNFYSIPLLTVASELSQDDTDLREKVVDRFRALHSTNHVPVNIWALELLDEHWKLRDSGAVFSWLALALAKDWKISLL